MSQPTDGGPAFPALKYAAVEAGEEAGDYASEQGMTLRDWFAGMALQGMLACPYDAPWKEDGQKVSQKSYEIADAMLQQRETT